MSAAKKDTIQISDHFNSARLLRYTAPTALMMAFTSVYGVVDGLFVSNFAGKEAFSALNLIYPFIMLLGALGLMFGTGGTALVAKTLGEGDNKRANGIFSMIVYAALAVGVLGAVAGVLGVRPIGRMLGADGSLLDQAVIYGVINAIGLPFLIMQQASQSFMSAAGKPRLGLFIIVAAGVANIVLDALFIVVFGWGIAGAAIATVASQVIGGLVPLVYFARPNTSTLRLGKPVMDPRALGKACVNGSSELVSNIAMSLVGMLYNYQLMRYIGADGVAAYGVIQYVVWIFLSLVMGFSMGSSPLISYQYGAKNKEELSGLFRRCMRIILIANVTLTVLAQLLARPVAMLFVGYDAEVTQLTCDALTIYSFVFLLSGISIFGSAFFTALNNGLVSALISFLRSLVFETAAIMVLPTFFGEMGIWSAILVAEGMSVVITVLFLVKLRKDYGYA
jgi:putative MATE family efflux protein